MTNTISSKPWSSAWRGVGFWSEAWGGGQEALELLATQPFDVVILDVMMPGMDGIETLREIKLAWPGIQVVLLSGHGGEELGLRGMAYGAHAYLLKPVSLKRLVEIAYQAFEESGLRHGVICGNTRSRPSGAMYPRALFSPFIPVLLALARVDFFMSATRSRPPWSGFRRPKTMPPCSTPTSMTASGTWLWSIRCFPMCPMPRG